MPDLETETQIVTVAGAACEEDEHQEPSAYGELICEVKEVKGEDRVLRFIGTTPIRDRMGDEIPLSGWDFRHYKRHPIFMNNHDYRAAPLGRTLKISRETIKGVEGWVFDVEFMPEEVNPEADRVYRILKWLGFGASSVGFQSFKSERINESDEERAERQRSEPDKFPGWRFLRKELLELSNAWIPANPEALMVSRKKGLEAVAQCIRNELGECQTMPDGGYFTTANVINPDDMSAWIASNKEAIETTRRIKAELDVVTKPGWDDEDEYTEIRYRVREPDLFQEGSFKRITIKKDEPHVFGIIGKLKGETKTTLQALRFPKKEGWTLSKAKAWLKAHPDAVKTCEAVLSDLDVWGSLLDVRDFVGDGADASGPAGDSLNTASADAAGAPPVAVTNKADAAEGPERICIRKRQVRNVGILRGGTTNAG